MHVLCPFAGYDPDCRGAIKDMMQFYKRVIMVFSTLLLASWFVLQLFERDLCSKSLSLER